MYGNGRGQRSNSYSQWLRVLGYSRKTRKMSREARRKLAQRKAMRDFHGVVVQAWLNQIPPPQTTGRDEPQCRGTIRNVFEVRTKAFSKSTSYFLRNSLFSLKVHLPHNYYRLYTYDSWRYPKKLSVTPCVVLCIALCALKRFTYIAAGLYFWLEKYDL